MQVSYELLGGLKVGDILQRSLHVWKRVTTIGPRDSAGFRLFDHLVYILRHSGWVRNWPEVFAFEPLHEFAEYKGITIIFFPAIEAMFRFPTFFEACINAILVNPKYCR